MATPVDPNLINNIGWMSGVTPAGTPTSTQQSVPLAPLGSAQPDSTTSVIPSQTSTTAPSSPNGGTTYQDKSNDIALQNAGLGAVDTQTKAGLAAIQDALDKLLGNYDTEAQQNQKVYQTQSDTNQNNLQSNKESALLNAAQGRRGLFGTLASLGALNGDGINLANRAVQQGANEDLSGAADNYATNQNGLDTALNAFKQADAERRQHAQDAADNNRKSVQHQAAEDKQNFLGNLANDYAAEGNTAQAKTYSDQAAALYPDIAATNVPTMSMTPENAAFTPTSLANYLSGANSTQVSTSAPTGSGAGAVPGLFAGNARRKTA